MSSPSKKSGSSTKSLDQTPKKSGSSTKSVKKNTPKNSFTRKKSPSKNISDTEIALDFNNGLWELPPHHPRPTQNDFIKIMAFIKRWTNPARQSLISQKSLRDEKKGFSPLQKKLNDAIRYDNMMQVRVTVEELSKLIATILRKKHELLARNTVAIWGRTVLAQPGSSTKIEKLSILNHKFSNLKPIHPYLGNLEYLNLSINPSYTDGNISDLGFTTSLPRLKELRLIGNKIVDITPIIEYCNNITILWLGRNPIVKLGDITRLKKLEVLDLHSCNQIEDFTPLYQAHNMFMDRVGVQSRGQRKPIKRTDSINHNQLLQLVNDLKANADEPVGVIEEQPDTESDTVSYDFQEFVAFYNKHADNPLQLLFPLKTLNISQVNTHAKGYNYIKDFAGRDGMPQVIVSR